MGAHAYARENVQSCVCVCVCAYRGRRKAKGPKEEEKNVACPHEHVGGEWMCGTVRYVVTYGGRVLTSDTHLTTMFVYTQLS